MANTDPDLDKINREIDLQITRFKAHQPKLRWALKESRDAGRREAAEKVTELGEFLLTGIKEESRDWASILSGSVVLVSFLKVYLDAWEKRYGPADRGMMIYRRSQKVAE